MHALVLYILMFIAPSVSSPVSPVDLSQAGKPQKNLVLILSAKHTSYDITGHIAVTLTVKNLGPDIWIDRTSPYTDYNFTFFSPTGDTLPIREITGLPVTARAAPAQELQTGGSWSETLNLNDYYELIDRGDYQVIATSPIFLKDQNKIYTTLISNRISVHLF